jgi:hypothetical protein
MASEAGVKINVGVGSLKKRLAVPRNIAESVMTDRDEFVELRLTESNDIERESQGYLHLQASIEVDMFTARAAFAAQTAILAEFLEQLERIVEQAELSAKLECGLVEKDVDVVYFSCEIQRIDAASEFVAQISLGTARSDGLLHRLHVGLPLGAASVMGFRRDLQAMLTNHKGIATLQRWREPQTN